MATEKASRKQLFRAALALAGMTAVQWAESEGVTANYVSQVLHGRMESKRLEEKMDAFIDQYLISQNVLVA